MLLTNDAFCIIIKIFFKNKSQIKVKLSSKLKKCTVNIKLLYKYFTWIMEKNILIKNYNYRHFKKALNQSLPYNITFTIVTY